MSRRRRIAIAVALALAVAGLDVAGGLAPRPGHRGAIKPSALPLWGGLIPRPSPSFGFRFRPTRFRPDVSNRIWALASSTAFGRDAAAEDRSVLGFYSRQLPRSGWRQVRALPMGHLFFPNVGLASVGGQVWNLGTITARIYVSAYDQAGILSAGLIVSAVPTSIELVRGTEDAAGQPLFAPPSGYEPVHDGEAALESALFDTSAYASPATSLEVRLGTVHEGLDPNRVNVVWAVTFRGTCIEAPAGPWTGTPRPRRTCAGRVGFMPGVRTIVVDAETGGLLSEGEVGT